MSIPNTTPPAGDLAENYIDNELLQMKRVLRQTQIWGSVTAVLLLGYLIAITASMASSLEPKNASEIAKGLVAERVDSQANAIADDLKQRVPALIEQAPDYALKQIPQYRQDLENRIEADLSNQVQSASGKMDEQLDAFLDQHKDEVHQMLQSADDKEVMGRLCDELQKEFMASLKETPAPDGETLQSKIDKSLVGLKDVESKMNRLAAGKNPTPQEQKARRAIAILSQQIAQKQTEEGTTPDAAAASTKTPGGA